MRRSATVKLHAYLALVAALLAVAFALRKPEMIIIATPFAIMLVAGLLKAAEKPHIAIAMQCPRERAVEGEQLTLRVTVDSDRDVQLLDIAIVLPDEQGQAVSHAYDEGRAAERILIAASMLGLGAGIL